MLTKPIFTLGPIGIGWKGFGYLTSIVSVFFLGAIAWPKPIDPAWHLPALVIGMATSVIGMAFRFKAHLDQQREIRGAKAGADHADGRTTSTTSPRTRRGPPASGRR
jgi:hypothetical protein